MNYHKKISYEKFFKDNEKGLSDLFDSFVDETCDALKRNIKFKHFKDAMYKPTIEYYDKAYEIFKEETIKKYK